MDQFDQGLYLSVECPWSQRTFSREIVQLEYWNDLTGQFPWTMSTESMEMSTESMDIGVHGHCPWTQWTLSSQFLGSSPHFI